MQDTAKADLEDYRKGELRKMVTEGWTARVVVAVEDAIRSSFQGDQVIRPVMTKAEITRRFNICVRGFSIMRRDLKWAVPRILDELPTYLRSELDGIPWNPDEDRQGWIAKGDRPMDVDGEDMAPELTHPIGAIEIGDEDPPEG